MHIFTFFVQSIILINAHGSLKSLLKYTHMKPTHAYMWDNLPTVFCMYTPPRTRAHTHSLYLLTT